MERSFHSAGQMTSAEMWWPRYSTEGVINTHLESLSVTSKQKHSLTRKLVGYRNWRQRWCKKEGNKGFWKRKMRQNPIFSTCTCNNQKKC